MKFKDIKPLTVGNHIATLPIVQGGMGIGISLANLASAVANEGGVGVLSAAGIGMFDNGKIKAFDVSSALPLREEIRKTRLMTRGVIGINIMVAMTHYEAMVTAAIDEGIDIIFSGAGLPLNLPKFVKDNHHTKLVPIISSGRAAALITKKWLNSFDYLPDGFVLEGPKAGGHLGFKPDQIDDESFTLEKLLPEVLEALKPYEEAHKKKIPVIVAGGIYTGADIAYFLSHGASGVQMATRFVTTEECDASDAFKQAYIDAKEDDIRIIKSPVGLPGRAIFNPYLEAVEAGKKHPFSCPYECIITCTKEQAPYCISLALYNAKKGRMSHGFAFAGTNAYLAKNIGTVKGVFEQLKEEFDRALT